MAAFDEAKSFGFKLRENFAEICPELSSCDSLDDLRSRIIFMDFEKKKVFEPFFPNNNGEAQQSEFELTGPVVLQISSKIKFKEPFINRAAEDKLVTFNLTDGTSTISAVELEHNCEAETVLPGSKVLYLGGKVIDGQIGLTLTNFQFLGGGTSHHFEQLSLNDVRCSAVEIIPSFGSSNVSYEGTIDIERFVAKSTAHFSVLSNPTEVVYEPPTPAPTIVSVTDLENNGTRAPSGPVSNIADLLTKGRSNPVKDSWYQPMSPKKENGAQSAQQNVRSSTKAEATRQPVSALRKLNKNDPNNVSSAHKGGADQQRRGRDQKPELRTHYAIEAPVSEQPRGGKGSRQSTRPERIERPGRGGGRQQQQSEVAPTRPAREPRERQTNNYNNNSRGATSSGIVFSATPPQPSGIIYSNTAPTEKAKPGSIRPNNKAPPPGMSSAQPKSGIVYSATPPQQYVPAPRSSGIVYSSVPPVQANRSTRGNTQSRENDNDRWGHNEVSHDKYSSRERTPRENSSRSLNNSQYVREPVPAFAMDPSSSQRERTPRERLPEKSKRFLEEDNIYEPPHRGGDRSQRGDRGVTTVREIKPLHRDTQIRYHDDEPESRDVDHRGGYGRDSRVDRERVQPPPRREGAGRDSWKDGHDSRRIVDDGEVDERGGLSRRIAEATQLAARQDARQQDVRQSERSERRSGDVRNNERDHDTTRYNKQDSRQQSDRYVDERQSDQRPDRRQYDSRHQDAPRHERSEFRQDVRREREREAPSYGNRHQQGDARQSSERSSDIHEQQHRDHRGEPHRSQDSRGPDRFGRTDRSDVRHHEPPQQQDVRHSDSRFQQHSQDHRQQPEYERRTAGEARQNEQQQQSRPEPTRQQQQHERYQESHEHFRPAGRQESNGNGVPPNQQPLPQQPPQVVTPKLTIEEELEQIDQKRRRQRDQSRGGGQRYDEPPMPEPPLRELQPFFGSGAGTHQHYMPLSQSVPSQRVPTIPTVNSPLSGDDWIRPTGGAAPAHFQQSHHHQPPFQQQMLASQLNGGVPHPGVKAQQQQESSGGKVMGISQENIQRILEQQAREAAREESNAHVPHGASRHAVQQNRLFSSALNMGGSGVDPMRRSGGGRDEREPYFDQHQQQQPPQYDARQQYDRQYAQQQQQQWR